MLEQDIKALHIAEVLKERKSIHILQERMDGEKRKTRDWRDLKLSQEHHQRELEQMERHLQAHGIDTENL